MSQFKGFFDLQEPADLLTKLEYDYNRLLSSSNKRVYAAFDFFITGYHMLDWVYPGDENINKRKSEENKYILLQVCSHIANGVKHFQATRPQHNSISHADHMDSSFQLDASQTDSFQTGYFVELTGDAAKCLGTQITCEALAEKVLEFWQNHEYFSQPG